MYLNYNKEWARPVPMDAPSGSSIHINILITANLVLYGIAWEFLQNDDGHFHVGFPQSREEIPAGKDKTLRRLRGDHGSCPQAIIKQGKFPKKSVAKGSETITRGRQPQDPQGNQADRSCQ